MLFLKAIDSRFNTVVSIILNSEALSSIDEMYSKIMLDYQRQDTKSTIEIHAAFTRVVDGKQTKLHEKKDCQVCGGYHHSDCPTHCLKCKRRHYIDVYKRV